MYRKNIVDTVSPHLILLIGFAILRKTTYNETIFTTGQLILTRVKFLSAL